METMTRSETEMMAQDKAAVNKLNQLLSRMRTDFLPRKNSISSLSGLPDNNDAICNNNSRNNNNDVIPRSKTCDSRMDKSRNKNKKKERKRSLPILTTQIKQEVVDQLDGLLGHLETMGEENLVRSPPPPPKEPQYAKVNKQKTKAKTKENRESGPTTIKSQTSKTSHTLSLRRFRRSERDAKEQAYTDNVVIEEPPYSQISDLDSAPKRDSNATEASSIATRGDSVSSFSNEPYMLEDAASYLLNKFVFSRQVSVDSKYYSKNYCDLNLDVSSTIHAEHSTLCRRLKSLEASVGITLKKQLHSFVKKKMNSMNVSGCIYCMYAFYEKHKREADEKAQEIRKTIAEQEFIKQTLDEQKKQSDADSKWLENEERFSYIGDCSPNGSTDDDEKRYGWRDNLHNGGSKSDSEQLGCASAKDVKKKKLPPLRLRRSIPLWELLKRDRKSFTTTEESPSAPSTPTSTQPDALITDDTHPITPLSVDTYQCYDTPKSPNDHELTKNEKSELLLAQTIENLDKNDNTTKDNNADENEGVSTSRTEIQAESHTGHGTAAITLTSENDLATEQQKETNSVRSSHTRASLLSTESNCDSVVYHHTANLVKSVLHLNTGMQHAKPEEFVDLVNVVGLNLRDLLARVDDEVRGMSLSLQKEVEMAHRVLSSDMADLVNKMKIAQKYADTMVDTQSRREMLQAAHVLAIDTKNFYDTYIHMITLAENSNPS